MEESAVDRIRAKARRRAEICAALEESGELEAAVLTAPQSKKVYLSFPGTLEPICCCLSRFIIYILRNHFFFLHLCKPARRTVDYYEFI